MNENKNRLTPGILFSYGFEVNEEKTEWVKPLPYGNGTDLILEDDCGDFTLPLDVVIIRNYSEQKEYKIFMYLNSIRYERQLLNLWLGITNNKLEKQTIT